MLYIVNCNDDVVGSELMFEQQVVGSTVLVVDKAW